ncbi:MAG: LysM peptidoglycan-binding domain-containing protein, partial [Candidatus Sericytochromatia bacterium]|nr:LysM peptidoglycan-binding domain-containing protein [Candidatus Tanganyikabacteria bacterium]
MGSGARWADLYRANRGRVGADPRLIRPGMRLVLAPAEGRVAQTSARYRVRPGDSLWSIAERHLGRGEKWEALYARNRGSIGADPRLIRPGTVLVLGDAPAVAAAPRKAVKPAKPVARAPVAKPAKPVARAPVAKP